MRIQLLTCSAMRTLSVCGLSVLMAPVGQADLFSDSFGTPGVPSLDGRVWDARLDTGWRATTGYGSPNSPSLWSISAAAGGRLENPANIDPTGNGSQYTESESPVWQWWSNPDAGSNAETKISLSFDFGTGSGDALHAHLWVVQSGGAAGAQSFITNNEGWANGNSGQNQVSSAGGFVPFNLLNGSNAPANGSVSGALTGTDTYTALFDLGALGIPGVSTVGDVDTFFIAFAANETGGGTTWVDNVSVAAVPEASTSLLLAVGGMLIWCGRRRRR